jgi:excisionase family DNA binding protein
VVALALGALRGLFAMRKAIDQYYVDNARDPRNLKTLEAEGYLPKIPTDRGPPRGRTTTQRFGRGPLPAATIVNLIFRDIMRYHKPVSKERTPLFVRLPRSQAAALDRLADATGRRKQSLVSELIGDRLAAVRPLSVGRIQVTNALEAADEVLTLDETAALLKLPADAVRTRAEGGDLPGRRLGNEWRFARSAILAWLADGEPHKRNRNR